MTLVVDASVVVAALTGTGTTGTWADSLLESEQLLAPHLMPVEVVSMLRRTALAGNISVDAASRVQARLLALRAALFPYEPFAHRVWELRDSIRPYDAWYVALAEFFGVGLATLDGPLYARSRPSLCFR